MDSYIALTLFGCFFVLVFIGVPISGNGANLLI